MPRAFLIVLDSLGVGALPDAADFGDQGAHTLDHLVEATGGLDAPRLLALGLGNVPGVESLAPAREPVACHGRMAERSPGKDTTTGHWEMMGCVLERRFPVFPDGFPPEVIDAFVERAQLPGVLGNEPASGTEIIERLGPEHLATGKPIVYTSADSVFQVAAHQERFGLERLLAICRVARDLLDPLGVGRVIARPFVGEPGSFRRTYERRDFSLPPPADNTLTRLQAAGVPVVGIGKIEDIFAGVGITASIHSEGNRDGMRALTREARTRQDGLVLINLVDFDMLYGHRRDPAGYRRALEELDDDLGAFEAELRTGDLVLMTADHGNDPTFTGGTDHTREYVPLLAWKHGERAGRDLGTRETFADLGATVEQHFGASREEAERGPGRSFLRELEASA